MLLCYIQGSLRVRRHYHPLQSPYLSILGTIGYSIYLIYFCNVPVGDEAANSTQPLENDNVRMPCAITTWTLVEPSSGLIVYVH